MFWMDINIKSNYCRFLFDIPLDDVYKIIELYGKEDLFSEPKMGIEKMTSQQLA